MNQRKKLLYIMGIDWDWIFQRPQILEQHLEENYDVTVIFPRSILHFWKKSKSRLPADYHILWTIPLQEKNKLIGWLASFFAGSLFHNIHSFDAVMVGYPLYYRYIPVHYGGKLIYDCMDNHAALYPYQKGVGALIRQETKLAERCDALFVSGSRLQQKMIRLVSDTEKVHLVRNGVFVQTVLPPKAAVIRKKYKVGYFGTIAEWFDFGVLLKSLEKSENLEYHLIGPVREKQVPSHERIIMEGIVAHQKLTEFTADYDCLIMPFRVNDVVEWVDPVKLYEYIALGKCIISVRYAEIERFNDYVYLYTENNDYVHLVNELAEKGFPPKYTAAQQQEFLRSNSWDTRFQQVDQILDQL